MPTQKTPRNSSDNGEPENGAGQSAFIPDNLPTEQENHNDSSYIDDSQQKNAPFVKTGNLGQFFKKVTDRLKPVSQSLTKPLETPESELSPKPSQPAAPGVTRRLFPFDTNEPFPGPGNTGQLPTVNINPRPAGNANSRSTGNIGARPTGNIGSNSTSGTNSLSSKKPGVTTPLNKLAQKLDSQGGTPFNRPQRTPERKQLPGHFEKDKQLHQDDLVQPFVGEDAPDDSSLTDSLAVKIKKGSVPAETLRLLITASMTDAEVHAICTELNIDWELVPGDNREDKTLYLIEYFNKRDTHLDYKEVATSLWSQLPNDEESWGDSDARLKELQASLTEPEVATVLEPAQEQKELSFWEHLREDFAQASMIQKVLVIGLSLIVFVLLVVIAFFVFPARAPISTPPPSTTIPSIVPNPRALQLPGGWIFDLRAGSVQDGSWRPTGPEWLEGTEICRLVSLPWNRQLDAVYQSFQVGDELLLTMSNDDLLHYRVHELKTLDLIDLNSDALAQITNANTPCLAIVLTKPDTQTRQLLLAEPVSASIFQAGATATYIVPATPNPDFPTATSPALAPSPSPTTSISATVIPTKKP